MPEGAKEIEGLINRSTAFKIRIEAIVALALPHAVVPSSLIIGIE